MKAGIAIDDWKLPIFERHLAQSGYTWTTNTGALVKGTLFLTVDTPNGEALLEVIKAANAEAARTKQ